MLLFFYMPSVMDLLLYVVQQLGVMFAVGAQTIILLAYILSVRDGVVDSQEERFAHAIKKVLFFGIILILVSGAAITALELFAGNHAVVFAPAYLFKACLIGLVVFLSLAIQGDSVPEGVLEGLAGGTWYALFMVHILAPVAAWNQLVVLYVIWIIGFMTCWSALLYMMRGRVAAYADVPNKKSQPAPTPRSMQPRQFPTPTIPTPVSAPLAANPNYKPVTRSPKQESTYIAPRPYSVPQNLPTMPTPTPQMANMPLPTIRVMPKSADDMQKQQNSVVGLNAHPL